MLDARILSPIAGVAEASLKTEAAVSAETNISLMCRCRDGVIKKPSEEKIRGFNVVRDLNDDELRAGNGGLSTSMHSPAQPPSAIAKFHK